MEETIVGGILKKKILIFYLSGNVTYANLFRPLVWFIEKYIKIRSRKFKHGHTHNLCQNHYEKLPKLSLPFNKNFNSLSNILKSYNIGTIPLVKKSLSSIIRLGKDTTKKWDCTNVVYKFDCKNCSATYKAFHVNSPSVAQNSAVFGSCSN